MGSSRVHELTERTVRNNKGRADLMEHPCAGSCAEHPEAMAAETGVSASQAEAAPTPPKRKQGSKAHMPSRVLQKEKTRCPKCDKVLQISSLAYSHRCKRPKPPLPPEVVRERLERMVSNASKKFERRAALVQKGLEPDAACTAKDAAAGCREQGGRDHDAGDPASAGDAAEACSGEC